MMRDILFIDKPKGMSSFDVIRYLRRRFREDYPEMPMPKMGHAGTLDPLASGLMIVGVGRGTKKLDRYLHLPKRYTVEILLGESRTTGDMEGEIVETKEVTRLDKAVVKQVLRDIQTTLRLPVPRYSAVKMEGEKLYEKARNGEEFDPPVRPMRVYHSKLLFLRRDLKENIITVRLEVESGVYIRSIVEEIGRRLGYPATTFSLRRTKIGIIQVNDAQKLEDI